MEIIKNTTYNQKQANTAFRAIKQFIDQDIVSKVVIEDFQHGKVIFRATTTIGEYFVIVGTRGAAKTGWNY